MARFFRRLRTFPATDPAGRVYALEVWGYADGSGQALRLNGRPVTRVSKGVYRVPSAHSPTGEDLELRADDPDAP